MARELKFRAWRRRYAEMVPVHNITFDANGEVKTINTGAPAKYDLMQYTGLKDKNGVEIYEGDVIRSADQHWEDGNEKMHYSIGQVCYLAEIEMAEFSAMQEWGTVTVQAPCNSMPYLDSKVEVIGNIYENGDLLK